jgi:ribosomal-protein-alanine acetyltransferase
MIGMKHICYRRGDYRDIGDIEILEKSEFGEDAYNKEFIQYLIDVSDIFIVALDDDKVIGYISGSFLDRNVGYLSSILISKKYRGSSIGTSLIRIFKYLSEMRGIDRIYLHVATDNGEAIKFYRKHGFTIVGLIKNYYKSGKDAYIMETKI